MVGWLGGWVVGWWGGGGKGGRSNRVWWGQEVVGSGVRGDDGQGVLESGVVGVRWGRGQSIGAVVIGVTGWGF